MFSQEQTERLHLNARVNESAETVVENKATIQIGENGPEYETDTDRKEITERWKSFHQ